MIYIGRPKGSRLAAKASVWYSVRVPILVRQMAVSNVKDISEAKSKKIPGNPKGLNGTEKLTGNMLHYCRCRASGQNLSDSYRESYGTSGMTKKSINEASCRLDKRSKIQSRIDYLIGQKEAALIRSEVSLREKVLTKLESFMDSATPQDASKIRAAELLGKSIGLFTEVIEDRRNLDKSPEELKVLLTQKLSKLLVNETA